MRPAARPHTLCGRIRRDEIRMLRLKLAQFTQQPVIFRIRDLRRIHDMIKIFVMAKSGS
jgi:hypothetical protein